MKTKRDITWDIRDSDGSFSVRKQTYMETDGKHQDLGLPKRGAFCPREFEELKEFAPELESIAKDIWALEFIADWQRKQDEVQNQIM